MKFSHSVKGLKKVQKALQSFESEVKEGQIEAVRESIFLIHGTAVKSLQDNSSGTPVMRYKPKRTVLASKPGTPPNTDTGRAVQSIKFDFKNKGLVGRVGTNLKYLAALEFGFSTKKGVTVAPRPWLSLAIAETAKEVAKIFADALRRSTKKVSK
jgi:phage gpG-like protein